MTQAGQKYWAKKQKEKESSKLPIIISDTVVELIHAEWTEALIWRPLQTIVGRMEFLKIDKR